MVTTEQLLRPPITQLVDLDAVVVIEEIKANNWLNRRQSRMQPLSENRRMSHIVPPSISLRSQSIEFVYSTLRAFFLRLLLCGS